MKRTVKRILAVWLLILFVGYTGSVTLFYHTHTVGGQRIAHSHPYSQAPDKSGHTHSAAQLAQIAQLSLLVMLAAGPGGCLTAFFFQTAFYRDPDRIFHRDRDRRTVSLRGPPFSLAR